MPVDLPSMIRVLALASLYLVWGGSLPQTASATSASAYGVVWTPTGSEEDQIRMVRTLRDHELQAIRTTHVPHSGALQAAAAMNIAVYVDVRPPSELDDWVHHPAVHGIGWSGGLSAHGCDQWQALRATLPEETLPYVVAPLSPSAIPCSFEPSTTVLVDAREHPSVFTLWQQWTDVHAGRVGIGAIAQGRWADAPAGWNVPRSAEAQARYVEHTLTEAHQRGISPVFTAGWSLSSNRGRFVTALWTHDGLTPAGRVVVDATHTAPTPLALPPGSDELYSSSLPSSVVLSIWLLVGGLAWMLIQLPVLRRTMQRYLFTPTFYHDSMREGREVTPRVTGALFFGVGGALIAGGSTLLYALRDTRAAFLAFDPLSKGAQSHIEALLGAPFSVVAVGGGIFLAGVAVWALIASLSSRWAPSPLSWLQTMTLALMPGWLMLPWLLAVVIASFSLPPYILVALAGGAGLILAWIGVRTGYDLYRTSRIPVWLMPPLIALTPSSLALASFVYWIHTHVADPGWLALLLWHA